MPGSWWTRFYAFAIGVLIVCATSLAQAEAPDVPPLPTGFQLRTFADDSGEHRFLLFLPEDYRPDHKWPVVLFLHGAGERGNDGIEPLTTALPVALEQMPDAPFIAVLPQSEDMTQRYLKGWEASTTDGQRALKILQLVESEFSVDPQRRILCGWSMGGYGAWSLAAAHPEMWSAVLAISGGALEDGLPLKPLAESGTPVWAVAGKQDTLVSSDQSARLIQSLNEQGGDGTLSVLDQAGHDVWRSVFADPRTFQWMVRPASIDPGSIDLTQVTPLPYRTQFYRQYLLKHASVSDALAVRLGNEALQDLSQDIAQSLPPKVLEGKLKDIQRHFSRSGSEGLEVTFSQIHYSSHVDAVSLRAISGGRLQVIFAFHPLTLSIGHTEISSRRHQAHTGPIDVEIGRHRPAHLIVEVQPLVEDDCVKLRPLRQRFHIDDANWYIHPPEEVQVQSPTYGKREVVIGILGSLYEQREEFEKQVLKVVPGLLETVEQQLAGFDAPRLAEMLAPLPGMSAEIQLSASDVRTDPKGLSMGFDLEIATREKDSHHDLPHPVTIADLEQSQELALELGLGMVREVSAVTIRYGVTSVNVLDITGSRFKEFADPQVMSQILPKAIDTDHERPLRTVVRLLDPVEVSSASEQSNADAAGLLLNAPRAALDVWTHANDGTETGVGRLIFSLTQPIQIDTSEVASGTAPASNVKVVWQPATNVRFLKVEPLDGSAAPEVNAAAFETRFREVWIDWSQQHGNQTVQLGVSDTGLQGLRLQSLLVNDEHLKLRFEAAPVPTVRTPQLSSGQ